MQWHTDDTDIILEYKMDNRQDQYKKHFYYLPTGRRKKPKYKIPNTMAHG
jgi:hypothetical protein